MKFHALPVALALLLPALLCLAAAAHADRVALTTGDVLHGTITSTTDAAIQLNHPVLGALTIPADTVASAMTNAELQAADTDAAPPAPTPAPAAVAPQPAGFFDGWDSELDAGLSGTSGNSDAVAAYIKFVSRKQDDRDRWAYDATYRYASEDNKSATHRFTTGLVKDWLMPDSKWFYFADGRFDWDQFQSWQTRVQGHAGVGYQFLKDDRVDLLGRAGVGAIREFGSNNDDVRPEALAGLEGSWQFTDHQKLTGSTYVFPDFDDTGEFRAVNKLEWSMAVPDIDNASVKAGVRHEHQSVVDPGDEHNDFWYYTGVSFKF